MEKKHEGLVQIETQDGFEYGDVINIKGDRLTDLLIEFKDQEVEVIIKVKS